MNKKLKLYPRNILAMFAKPQKDAFFSLSSKISLWLRLQILSLFKFNSCQGNNLFYKFSILWLNMLFISDYLSLVICLPFFYL